MAGALEARGIPAYPEKVHSEVEGDIENIDGKALVTRIRVTYHLRVPKGKRGEAERAIEVHERRCPAAQSVKRGITIEWKGEIVEEE
ncbi:MAG: OsmC family protein [candidate division NC10 bacterium]|nr:OsmC family protein [candidate division NC10 bacterium]